MMPNSGVSSSYGKRPFKFNHYLAYYFPFKITIICCALLFMFHSIVILLQAVLTVRNLSKYNYYTGFWASTISLIFAILTFSTAYLRIYLWIIILVIGNGFSLLLTILGLIMFSLNAINTFEVCGKICAVNLNALPYYWAIFSLGIISSLISLILILSILLSLGGLFTAKSEGFSKNRVVPSF